MSCFCLQRSRHLRAQGDPGTVVLESRPLRAVHAGLRDPSQHNKQIRICRSQADCNALEIVFR